jgi:hypothetical protein
MMKKLTTTIVMLSRKPAQAAHAIDTIRATTRRDTTRIILGAHEMARGAIRDFGISYTADCVIDLWGVFNYSQANNRTLEHAGSKWGYHPPDDSALLFLNDDMDFRPAGDSWLEAMTAALDAGSPAVGMKLVYPPEHRYAGRIQHAGVTPGPNLVGDHVGFGADPEAPAYTNPPYAKAWAVTGAALACRTADFATLGGFDEGYQEISQDIDLSLALRELHGWAPAIVWQGTWALHYEGATRGGRGEDPDEDDHLKRSNYAQPDWERFRHKWLAKLPASLIIEEESTNG